MWLVLEEVEEFTGVFGFELNIFSEDSVCFEGEVGGFGYKTFGDEF